MIIELLSFTIFCYTCAQVTLPEDGYLNFTELATKYGQEAEEFDVVTEDGYILKLFRVKGEGSAVLLVHGLADSSDGFIVRGNISLAVNLARSGYDVWAINNRGNRYSRKHVTLDPDNDPAFWDFNVHEFGTKDLPATIDFILSKIGGKISIIGNSEGTTATLVLGATRPEYNDKVSVLISFAPICFLHHTKAHMSTVFKFAPLINRVLLLAKAEEFIGFYSPIKAMMIQVCSLKGVGYLLCVEGALFPTTGVDARELEPDFIPVLIRHYPAGTSRKNLDHLAQISQKKRFARYDYGPKRNIAEYGSELPPEYDLSKVTMRTAILMAKNDRIATVEDVGLLRARLPNVVEYRMMTSESFNHIDFVWGKTTYSVVLPQVLEILGKYSA